MFEGDSSLRIWAVILIGGALFIFVLGFFSRFPMKEDRAKLVKKKKHDKKDDSEGAVEPKTVLRLDAHFGGATYLAITSVISIAILVMFIREDFGNLANELGGDGAGTALAVITTILAFAITEGIMVVLPFLAEEKAITLWTAYYTNRYDTTVVTFDRGTVEEDSKKVVVRNGDEEDTDYE